MQPQHYLSTMNNIPSLWKNNNTQVSK